MLQILLLMVSFHLYPRKLAFSTIFSMKLVLEPYKYEWNTLCAGKDQQQL
jgi:hypothetical protein